MILPEFAISIRQPWAWLILHAGKDIENRSWPTKFRGRVLVHAAKGMTREEYAEGACFAWSLSDGKILLPRYEALDRGGIAGEVEIVGCVARSTSEWFVGYWGFELVNPRPLPFIPCRGALGFFRPVLPEATSPDEARARGIRCR